MVKARNLIIAILIFGLISIEVFASINNIQPEAAQSQRQLSSQEQSLIQSILEGGALTSAGQSSLTFVDIDLPGNPGDVSKDAQYSSNIVYRLLNQLGSSSSNGESSLLPAESTLNQSQLLQNVLPPLGSELYYAYQDGGKAWYQKGDNVLVIFGDETIRSFNKTTGKSTAWLQKELSYPPIDDPDAITNYQKNYNAVTVAETSQWVLMEFPSGGVLKVLKPSYTTSNTGGTFSANLPNILPGYDN